MKSICEKTNAKDDWNQHWEDFNESSALNPAQAYRRKLIIKMLKKKQYSLHAILDIGSGSGVLAKELGELFPNAALFGVELSSKGVELSKKNVPAASFFKMDLLSIEKMPTCLKQVADVAICSEVLEHLDNPLLFLQNASKLIKNKGHLLVTVPGGYRSAYDQYIGHRKHFKANDLKMLLEQAGFQIDTILLAGFPFFNLYKMITILRGKKLIVDSQQKGLSRLAKGVMHLFHWLFKLNWTQSPWGWQLVALATVPDNNL